MTKIRLAQYGGYIFLVRTVMTPRQVTLVQDTFKYVGRQAHEAGRIFYDELFLRAPELERLFTGDISRQKLKFVQMLATIVKSLDQIASMSEEVVDLGRRHLSYDVEDGHYEAMGDALMGMLNRVLGAEMTPEVSDAWAAAYGMIARVMTESSTVSHTAEGFYAAIIRSVMASQYGPSIGADKAVPGRAPVTQGIDRGGSGGQVIRLS
jgi:hemoglobin-like flavoprotein